MITVRLKKTIGYDENDNELYDIKIYTAPSPKAILLRRANEMLEVLQKGTFDISEFDMLTDFIVKLFGNKFTSDEFLEGIEVNELIPVIFKCISDLTISMKEKLGAIPNVAAE